MVLGVCLVLGSLCGWVVLYLTTASGAISSHNQTTLYSQYREMLASGTAPLDGSQQEGDPVALVSTSSGAFHEMVVVEGTNAGDLQSGPGHRRDTPLPGQEGVSVLYGRSVTFGGPFGQLDTIKPGDEIKATTAQGTFMFKVRGVRTEGQPLPAPIAAGQARLTLVTAAQGATGLSRWVPESQVYVDADLEGKAQPRSPVAATLPRDQQAMQGDPSALPMVLLWLQGLLVTSIATVWAWYRWGKPQTWLTGGAIALGLLWGLSAAASRLLPNLF